MNTVSNGTGLENFVCELYKDLGYYDVIRDYRVSKSYGNEYARGQIDIRYKHMFISRYVECKQRSERNVNFDEYAKFETTLKTFNIPTFFGELVTNKYFDEKVRLRAREAHIKLIDKDALEELNKKRNSGMYFMIMFYRFIETFEDKGLKEALKYLYIRLLPIEKQIKLLEN
ncbi:MAG: restriction endonuclease [Candidatus Woesearchaeota archaeon]